MRVGRLEVHTGQRAAIVGPSGSGKTTLLHLMAGILVPQTGKLIVAGQNLVQLDDGARRRFRIRQVGMVFQEFELVPWLRVVDNCLLPYLIGRGLRLERETRERAVELLRATGLENRLRSYPGQLSQGERQRLALCRALVTEPAVVLADEPTGNLDPANKQKVLDLMLEQVSARGATLVMVTHDGGLLERFDQVFDASGFAAGAGCPA